MPADADRYEAWYTEKLWRLLPEIYRAEDGETFDEPGPLGEVVARIGAQVAVVRRSVDRLWEDQSIESCDDWVIDYLGDLLATNLVASLDARGRRVDVAKTINYRRRKGTVGLLEELATDITGWTVRVVEQMHRLGRTRHALDPAIGPPTLAHEPAGELQRSQGLVGRRTRTGAGGFADLRDAHGANLSNTAFDEYHHAADIRRGRGATGWHGIPRIGVFVWRLHSMGVTGVDAVQDDACPNQYTFDPTGRDIPLFAEGRRPDGDAWTSPREDEVPGPISADLLTAAFDRLYARDSLYVRRYVGGPPPGDFVPVAANEVKRSWASTGRFLIDPTRGRLVSPVGVDDGPYIVDYHYGFGAEIGAGPYDRRDPALTPVAMTQPLPTVTGGGTGLAAALGAVAPTDTVIIDDSRTYTEVTDLTGIQDVVIRAGERRRPLVRPDVTEWVFTGVGDATLTLDGLFLSGVDVVLKGTFERVSLRCCTLDPGDFDPESGDFALAADDRPLRPSGLRVEGSVRTLFIERAIVGPISDAGGQIERLVGRDSIVHACHPKRRSITTATGEVELSRCTLLGRAQIHRLEASECVLADPVVVDDTQHGCVRFTAWTEGSALPRQYESVRVPANAALFDSVVFGEPEYGRLRATAGAAVLEGGEDGGELGAFARERVAIKERSLLIKYQEYLPMGLEPVVVHVT